MTEPSNSDAGSETGPRSESEDERERHASNLELFLDLVFVFAVTQIATLIGEHATVADTLKGALIAFLVWWQWSQYTWAGAAIDLQAKAVSRVLVLCTVPVTLLMTIAIPDAFGRSGPWFGAAYFGVQVLVISMQGALTIARPIATRWRCPPESSRGLRSSSASSRRIFETFSTVALASARPTPAIFSGNARFSATVMWG